MWYDNFHAEFAVLLVACAAYILHLSFDEYAIPCVNYVQYTCMDVLCWLRMQAAPLQGAANSA